MKQKDILFILILSFVVTVFWIGFNIHHNYVTSTISDTLNLQIQPITPSFDTDTIQKLKERTAVQPSYNIDITQVDAVSNQETATQAAVPLTTPVSPLPTQPIQVTPTTEPIELETDEFSTLDDPFGDESEGVTE